MELQKEFYTWKSALHSKGLKVNLVKTKVLVSNIGLINIKPSSSKDPCSTCGRRKMACTVLCKFFGN